MNPHPSLATFLAPYPDFVQDLFYQLRTFVLACEPMSNELIYDNYNAVATAYSKSGKLKDAFCHLAVYPKHVNLGFNRGAELETGSITLEGRGKRIRHYKVNDYAQISQEEFQLLIASAAVLSDEYSEQENKIRVNPQSIVMSVSKNKRRPM